MGRIAKLLSFVRTLRNGANLSDVEANPGGSPNITGSHFADPGDDSNPLPGDYVALITDLGTGRENIVGYLDIKNLQKSAAGDKRIYSRDASGAQISEVWLKNDGTILSQNSAVSCQLDPSGTATIQNAAGSITLQADGEVNINGARITTDGDIVSATGVSMNNHNHSQAADSNGDAEADTSASIATE